MSEIKSYYRCGQCVAVYTDYKTFLEHLYWRHGTQSYICKICRLKRWRSTVHICHVLPVREKYIDDSTVSLYDECLMFNLNNKDTESEYCYCRKETCGQMIGCDGPACVAQWYHFACVGISEPPAGKWFCPECRKR